MAPLRLVILAIAFYGLGHALRAVRLAVVGVPLLRWPARALLLLHFRTAPTSFVLPFKLGELYRFQQLGGLSVDGARALLVIVVERMMDAIVLSGLCFFLFAVDHGVPANLLFIAVVLSVSIALALLVLVAFGPALATLQGYIFRHHFSPGSRTALRLINSLRRAIAVATESLRGSVLILLLLTAGIWACEWISLVVLLDGWGGGGVATVIGVISMALSPQEVSVLPQSLIYLYTLVALLFMGAAWPVATMLHLRYFSTDARRSNALSQRPLPLARLPRRVRLNALRRTTWHTR
ncbi:hypothetical protein ULB03_26250 [Nitrospirillum sp. BR 11828]|nr:lysylphosphatidylglycerol synthase domain-containing protein [Nitrospirillum sp. BR 11828]MDZ5650608.1 hypothetical protein [Nitrospirillum sp. BR 11828]